MNRRCGQRCRTSLLYAGCERPVPRSEPAAELGALGGTRTPNLLIRRSMEGVRPVCRNPYPQVSVLPDVRHGRRSPAPSGQSVRKL
jgi:hypothetical protein